MFEIIVARDLNHAIGYKNNLLYHLQDDMKRFKQLTLNHKIIMGRKTFNSFNNPQGLKNRTNIVLTRNDLSFSVYENSQVFYTNKVEKIINQFTDSESLIYVIGGESIYKLFLPYAKYINVTEIQSKTKDYDTKFEFNENEFKLIYHSQDYTDKKSSIKFNFNRYERI